ncbi:hypothetical protein VMCG_09813 [Cytospora schulzeri]|uniref:Zn(2)-C6 fungal-type domain-containing protein n=1 Tax=Cytospora schulzeri TaxID=448051 RepID=A0A423VHP8_9PEZI|nr:hypothetical protein VMCG_09813 [Valsa malicola]
MSDLRSLETSERHSLEGSEPPSKRRKVRKGTKSCWECRRRKIKCQFDNPDDINCIGCKQRGTVCRSQEYDDDNAPEPGQRSDPPLTRRLDRLEQMMERIVDRIVPDETGAPGPSSSQPLPDRRSASASSSRGLAPGRESSVDILQASAAGDGPIAALLAMRHESVHRRGPSESGPVSTPAMTSIEPATPTLPASSTPPGGGTRAPMNRGQELPSPKHFWVCTTLRNVIPSTNVIEAILAASPGAPCVPAICYTEAERLEGKVDSTSSLTITPPIVSHPLLLARRALQVLICVQQLPPAFDYEALGTGYPLNELMYRLSATSLLATSNDELIGYAEGVECLLLQGYSLANSGSLRKAWITIRRAMSLAQVMGVDRGHSAAFRSCDPKVDPARRPSARVLWYRLVFWDRYLSLLLGLPTGSQGNEFASAEACKEDTPTERLEKVHTVLSARILERNRSLQHQRDQPKNQPASLDYAVTQEIDLELEAAARFLPPGWWDKPTLESLPSQEVLWEATTRTICQIHHFTLLILLHVPYMIRGSNSPRFEYSKTICMTSARELLTRFITFRSIYVSSSSCRRVDYAALIASMTLCLAYLGRRRSDRWDQIREDAELVDATRRRMDHVAGLTGDKLNRETVETIESLMSIINRASTGTIPGTGLSADARELQFNVPYLGSISIKMARPKPPAVVGLVDPIFEPMDIFESPSLSEGVLEFAPYDDQAPFGLGADAGPDLTADGDDWALQGVDSAYWSLFPGCVVYGVITPSSTHLIILHGG